MKRVLCLLFVSLLLPLAASGDEALEDQLRAEFVERFTRFVEWPVGVIPADGAFMICVSGESPVAPFLEDVVAGRNIKGRQAKVVAVDEVVVLDACHLLLIGESDGEQLKTIAETVGTMPVLTVAHASGAATHGVMINIVRKGEFVGFEINRGAVEGSGFVVSSNLLRLADVVEDN